jgi:hypothetical protein
MTCFKNNIRMKNIYVGIDNGGKGGLVAIDEDENIVAMTVMPMLKKDYDVSGIIDFFKKIDFHDSKINVVLEKAHTLPTNGCKSNFTTGIRYGLMQGILSALNISYQIVGPKVWQKNIFQGDTVKDTKEASIKFCLQKYPQEMWKGSERCAKYHDGITDACCMACYCKRLFTK